MAKQQAAADAAGRAAADRPTPMTRVVSADRLIGSNGDGAAAREAAQRLDRANDEIDKLRAAADDSTKVPAKGTYEFWL